MSGDLRERDRLKALHPEVYRDGELAGLGKLPPGTRERGGYPISFHQWPRDRRDAWAAGFNVGHSQRGAAMADRERPDDRSKREDKMQMSVLDLARVDDATFAAMMHVKMLCASPEAEEIDIPVDIMNLIRSGDDDAQSNVFWNVVRMLERTGFTVDAAVALLTRYPNGVAKRHRGRLRPEVERIYAKLQEIDARGRQQPNGAEHSKANGVGSGEGPPKRQSGDPGPAPSEPGPNFRPLAEFCAEFRPISYAVAGLMREGSLYTLTGRTGEGKTSWLVLLALAVATGRGDLIGRKVKKGRVAFATAENPDDLRMRFMVACFVFNIDPETINRDLLVSDNRVSPEAICDWIRGASDAFTLIVIDTWQAFFDGREPNNNAEAVSFTRRFRPLAKVNGQPVVVVAAHPVKQASNDNLLPYGGGGTLNEIDGNFTLNIEDTGLYCFHWLGKIRGLPFDPLHFRIDKLDSPDVVTVEGARVKMPVMFPVDEEAVEARGQAVAGRDEALLKALDADPGAPMSALAAAARIPRGSIHRALARLGRKKLTREQLGKWVVTKSGKEALKGAKTTDTANRYDTSLT